jgi:hypothetical protein
MFPHGIKAFDLGGPCFHIPWPSSLQLLLLLFFFTFIVIYCESPPSSCSLWDTENIVHSVCTVHSALLFIVLKWLCFLFNLRTLEAFYFWLFVLLGKTPINMSKGACKNSSSLINHYHNNHYHTHHHNYHFK